MKYTVQQDFLLAEGKRRQLTAGETLQDGDLEPDVMAQLVSQGTVLVEGAQSPDPEAKLSLEDDPDAATAPVERRSRGRG